MLNHAARTYLPVFQDQLRSSILGRKIRDARDDDAKPSAATDEQVRNFFDAWHAQDVAAQSDALNKVVQTWRADNAAAGVPAHAHLALPNDFAKTLAQVASSTTETAGSPAFAKVIAAIDPSLQALVSQQVGALTRRPDEALDLMGSQSAVHGLNDADDKAATSEVSRRLRQRVDDARGRTMEYNPARDGAAGARTLPWDGRRGDIVPLAFEDTRGSIGGGMIPGGGTPPAPSPPRQDVPRVPLGPSSDKTFRPERRRPLPTALPSETPTGRDRRRYQIGNTRVDVPVNEDEADVVAGLDYLNNLRRPDGSPVVSGSFVNESTGAGVTVVDAPDGKVTDGSASQVYPWEYLRALGRLARSKNPNSPTGAKLTWRKPTEKANLEPDWMEAQRRFRTGDGSDAVIDPEPWGVGDDADEFADKAQRAANGEKGFGGNLRKSIVQAQATGEPQFVDILLPGSGPLLGARGLVMGQYAIRVRGVVVVKNGKYKIIGRATIVDAGKFNYDQDGQRNRSDVARWALWATQFLPDPANGLRNTIARQGRDYSIRANRDADVEIWGVVQSSSP